MNQEKEIERLFNLYVKEEKWRNMFIDDLKHGEVEIPFSNLCAIIRQENISLTPEDKVIINEIGESFWNCSLFWQNRMQTKYWYEIIGKPPYDKHSDQRRLIVLRPNSNPPLVEYNRSTLTPLQKDSDDWYIKSLPLGYDTINLLTQEPKHTINIYEARKLLERDLPQDQFEVLF